MSNLVYQFLRDAVKSVAMHKIQESPAGEVPQWVRVLSAHTIGRKLDDQKPCKNSV